MYITFFAIFCAVIAVFFFACAIALKKDRMMLLMLAATLSFVINQTYLITGYDIYGDVIVSETGEQSGIPTMIFGMLMLVMSIVILCREIRGKDES